MNNVHTLFSVEPASILDFPDTYARFVFPPVLPRGRCECMMQFEGFAGQGAKFEWLAKGSKATFEFLMVFALLITQIAKGRCV